MIFSAQALQMILSAQAFFKKMSADDFVCSSYFQENINR
jgi:hypothetical protein